MRLLAAPWALAAGCAAVVITDAVVLLGAARNRSGEPDARVELTEREIAAPRSRSRDDSSLFLTLTPATEVPASVRSAVWRRHREIPAIDLSWLGRDKLGGLGFDVEIDPGDARAPGRYDRPDNRVVFLVLEYDGEAWRRWIGGREDEVARLRSRASDGAVTPEEIADAEALLACDRTMRSRLVPIDAGLDPAALRRAHPDRSRSIVVRGLVRLQLCRSADGTPRLAGVVADVLPRDVRVPSRLRARLDDLVPDASPDAGEPSGLWPEIAEPRYRATVAFGARLEPYLLDVAVTSRP